WRGIRKGLDLATKLAVLENRPFAERLEDATRHLGGRYLCERQAKDGGGIGAVEHQPDLALCQDVRRAGAGMGDHPGGRARIGCVALMRAGSVEISSRRGAHSMSS